MSQLDLFTQPKRLKVNQYHLIKRMNKYLIAKQSVSEERKLKAEYTCRTWLKWTGFFLCTHKERYELFKQFKILDD